MTVPVTTFDREALETPTLLDAAEVDRLPWHPLPGRPGVWVKELWRFGDFVNSLIRYEPGARTAGEAHLAAHHHLWVVSGAASVAGRRLTAGSYAHIPPGMDHPVSDVGPEGCTVVHMHRPHGPQEGDFGRS